MQTSEPPQLQLSVLQVMAGALAAVTAAAVASTLGVAGTLLGAAVMSIVTTVGSALYNHSFAHAHARIRTRRTPRTGETEQPVLLPAPRRRLPWGRIAGMAGLVFALALGGITAVEVLAHRPLATLIRDEPTVRSGGTPPAAAGTTLELVLQPPLKTTPHVTPTPDTPVQAPADPAAPVTAEAEPPADGTPTSGVPTPVATPTAPNSDIHPMPSPTVQPSPSPEPTPQPSPSDTPSPPAEQLIPGSSYGQNTARPGG